MPRTPNVPADGFIHLTPETSYILGIIWSDGNVARPESGRHYIRVEMLSDDLDEIVPVFDTSGKWSQFRRTRKGREREILRLETGNKSLWEVIEPHKRDPLPLLSTMDEQLRPYWFRGMFDGDGCFYNPSPGTNQMFVGGCVEQDWAFLTSQLDALGISWSHTLKKHYPKNGNTSQSSLVRWTSSGGCLAWFDYTHNPTMKTFGLSRKQPTQQILDTLHSIKPHPRRY